MKKIVLLFAAILFVASGIQAVEYTPVPVDKDVRIGVLPNGLTYYIRHNEEPKGRCEFHIAQAVGASLEQDNQNGLAHFLEHMAFNGTKNFPGKLLINYFESVGVSFGYNINAYTSLDETVYRLSNVPTRTGVLDSALLVLHDWSCAIALEGEEIDNERGVIREEWRTGSTANRRLWRDINKQKYIGTPYEKRDVIGDTAVINNFSHKALRDYYKMWYGPDLQSIVIVGDIDVDKMEKKVKDLFSPIAPRKSRGVRPHFPLPENEKPILALCTDKEAAYSIFELDYKRPQASDEFKLSEEGYKFNIIISLAESMMAQRFLELQLDPNSAIMQMQAGYGNLIGVTDALQFYAVPKDGRELDACAEFTYIVEQIKRFGFNDAELEVAKSAYLNDMEKSLKEKDKRENISYAREYYRNYLDAEPIPGIEWEYKFSNAIVNTLSVEEINEVFLSLFSDKNIIFSFQGKDKGDENITKKDMYNFLSEMPNLNVEKPKEVNVITDFVKNDPTPGTIVKVAANEKLGTKEFTLSNGMKVVIKNTDFKNDQILMSMISAGGYSKVAVADLPSAQAATDIITQAGIAEYPLVDLSKYLAGKTVSVSPSIDEYSEEISGSSSIKDFETMLQVAYLYFTNPRKDNESFKSLVDLYTTILASRDSNPKVAFQDSINAVTSNHHERNLIQDLNWLGKINQDKAYEIFRQRFSNPADFTVILVGNIEDNEQFRTLIATWLGGIPATGAAKEKFVDNGIRSPKGVVKNYFEKEMQTNTASNRIEYTGKMKYDMKNRLVMNIIGELLSTRYLESIREKEGGSYGVGCSGYMSNIPVAKAKLLMQFDTDPEKQEKLMSIIHKEVMDIIANGPIMEDFNKTKESMRKEFEVNSKTNSYWKTALTRYYFYNFDSTDYLKALDSITPKDIQKTLKKLAAQGNIVEVVMLPKK